MFAVSHQYVDRSTNQLRTERLYQDRLVRWLYDDVGENAALLVKALTCRRFTRLAGWLNYDLRLGAKLMGSRSFFREAGINWSECLAPPESLDTARKVFERQIRYWECRPLPADDRAIVCPADSRVLLGSLQESSHFFIKGKFFDLAALLGSRAGDWNDAFDGGDVAIFRLTPEKYHYNHVPVSGEVLAIYEVRGNYHSCNPGAVVEVITPFSKNQRTVTVLNTDVSGGGRIGLVAMVEVGALMIGKVVQCYSDRRYDDPRALTPGEFAVRGQPKSLFQPGGSTTILIFQTGRTAFADDLLANQRRHGSSRFSAGFGRPLLETDVQVRSLLAWPAELQPSRSLPRPSSPTIQLASPREY